MTNKFSIAQIVTQNAELEQNISCKRAKLTSTTSRLESEQL